MPTLAEAVARIPRAEFDLPPEDTDWTDVVEDLPTYLADLEAKRTARAHACTPTCVAVYGRMAQKVARGIAVVRKPRRRA